MGPNGLLRMNTSIFNNKEMHETSKYSIVDLLECLYDLSVFISTNLQPNRLECFDVEALKTIVPYEA